MDVVNNTDNFPNRTSQDEKGGLDLVQKAVLGIVFTFALICIASNFLMIQVYKETELIDVVFDLMTILLFILSIISNLTVRN